MIESESFNLGQYDGNVSILSDESDIRNCGGDYYPIPVHISANRSKAWPTPGLHDRGKPVRVTV